MLTAGALAKHHICCVCCLQEYVKVGLLSVREDKHSGESIITSINRQHDLYRDFRPYKLQLAANSVSGSDAQQPTGSHGAADEQLVVEEVFKPCKEVKRKWLAVCRVE